MKNTHIDKRLKNIELEKEKLKSEKKKIIYSQKREESKKERRIRTHRIATKGAMLEKYFDCIEYSFDDTELLLKTFSDFVNSNKPKKLKEKYHDSEKKNKND